MKDEATTFKHRWLNSYQHKSGWNWLLTFNFNTKNWITLKTVMISSPSLERPGVMVGTKEGGSTSWRTTIKMRVIEIGFFNLIAIEIIIITIKMTVVTSKRDQRVCYWNLEQWRRVTTTDSTVCNYSRQKWTSRSSRRQPWKWQF